jgi:hypothetical protein
MIFLGYEEQKTYEYFPFLNGQLVYVDKYDSLKKIHMHEDVSNKKFDFLVKYTTSLFRKILRNPFSICVEESIFFLRERLIKCEFYGVSKDYVEEIMDFNESARTKIRSDDNDNIISFPGAFIMKGTPRYSLIISKSHLEKISQRNIFQDS